jgi:hypothetical protein
MTKKEPSGQDFVSVVVDDQREHAVTRDFSGPQRAAPGPESNAPQAPASVELRPGLEPPKPTPKGLGKLGR